MTILPRDGAPAGVYVHIPFCDRLCPYCDFAVVVRPDASHSAYLDALLSETALRKDDLDGRTVRTVYLGGGTPSALNDDHLALLLTELLRVAPDAAEVTLEANPNHVSLPRLRAWQAMGVTRISMGVQSFSDRYLQALGRTHSGAVAISAVGQALEVFDHVTLDLILGGPNHSDSELTRDLDWVRRLGVPHVSVYELTVEENTVFFRMSQAGTLHESGDDDTADMLLHAQGALETMGFEKYEVSNFAKPGFQSQHNRNYWEGGEYLGLGLGAHSLRVGPDVIRRANTRNLKSYLSNTEESSEVENLSASQHLVERLFVGLRAIRGVGLVELERQGLVEDRMQVLEILGELETLGLVNVEGDQISPTAAGMMMTNTIAERVARL
jgi:oxygen-independent coproporphyrinogen-3 oxidase